MKQRGILYSPDYVINAGGVISVAAEVLGDASRSTLPAHMDEIGVRLSDIFRRADRLDRSTSSIADEMAEQILVAGRTVPALEQSVPPSTDPVEALA